MGDGPERVNNEERGRRRTTVWTTGDLRIVGERQVRWRRRQQKGCSYVHMCLSQRIDEENGREGR